MNDDEIDALQHENLALRGFYEVYKDDDEAEEMHPTRLRIQLGCIKSTAEHILNTVEGLIDRIDKRSCKKRVEEFLNESE